jgi:hypothetical protein
MTRTLRALVALAAPVALLAMTTPAVAAVIHVVKSEYCGCCGDWIEHVRKAGHQVKVTNGDPGAEATRLGVPKDLRSCHTSTVGKYALEGHVPAADIARLLREKPNAAGLAVAGMPAGSPGMEAAGKQPFKTILFNRDGTRKVFASH